MTSKPIDREKLCALICSLVSKAAIEIEDVSDYFRASELDGEIGILGVIQDAINSGELDHDPWVIVDERLPERSGRKYSKSVLVYCPENRCSYTATYNHDEGIWEHFSPGSDKIFHVVTEWMPIPPNKTQQGDD